MIISYLVRIVEGFINDGTVATDAIYFEARDQAEIEANQPLFEKKIEAQ